MKRIIPLGIVLTAIGMLTASASAGIIDGSAVITAKPDGSVFDYTIKLTNTSGPGNDGIATFWFAWVPGKDFLPTQPDSVSLPTGWKDVITHAGTNDGYAIQFDANAPANDLGPGGTLTFGFTSADTPAELMGNSPFFSPFPVLTSFLYSVAPFVGDSEKFLVAFGSVPEPSSLMLGALGALGSLAWWRLRPRAIG